MTNGGESPGFQWLEPWSEVGDYGPDYATVLEQELSREVAPGHVLHGVPVEAAGKADWSDDVLFRLLDGSGRVAMVHLTLRRSAETPPWPSTELYASMEEWAEAWMRSDHEEFLLRQVDEEEGPATGEAV